MHSPFSTILLLGLAESVFNIPTKTIVFYIWLAVHHSIFERKTFRRIYGPKYEDEEWKIRTKRELEELNKGENIVKWIKGQRISWLGHVERIEEDRMPKKIFT
jgi:hypothetical protein